ncbi:MAG: signal peptidase II [Actinomycetota bacterium]|nr:signal peptidase II [Actinomycetota bacterium]
MTDPQESTEPSTLRGDAASTAEVEPRLRHRSLLVLLLVAAGVIALDRLTKYWVVSTIQPRIESGEGPIVMLGGLLKFTYVENTGAAFSLGSGYTWIFSIIAVVVTIVVLRSSRKLGSLWWAVALGGLLGGALGNLIDRLTREPSPGLGYVVDFIQLPNFAVFNVADMCIVGSAILMVLLSLKGVEFSGRARGDAS